MANAIPLTRDWSLGRQSDVAVNLMQPNASATLQNFLPNILGQPLVKRYPWSYVYSAHADFTTVSASTTGISGTNYASYQDGTKFQVYVDQAGRIITINTSGTAVLADATGLAAKQGGPGIMHLNKLYICPTTTGDVWSVDSSGTAADASTNVVDGQCGASWNDYLLIAAGNVLNFSDPFLDTFLNASSKTCEGMEIIRGVFPTGNAILVFGPRHFIILTGTTPPPNSDMVWRQGYPYGMATTRSAKMWNGYVIFANERGIFKTDGTTLADITERCGLSTAWRNDMQSFGSGWDCAMGVYQNYIIVTVTNAGVEQFTYCFDLSGKQEIGFNLKGFPTTMYAEVAAGASGSTANSEQDLIFGLAGAAQAGRFQPCVAFGTSGGKDANGVAIEYDWVSAFYQLGTPSPKRIRRAYWDYELDVASPYTEAPTWQYRVSNDPFSTVSWTTMTAPASGTRREPTFVNERARWVQFRIHGGTAAGTKNFALWGVDIEGHADERTRTSAR